MEGEQKLCLAEVKLEPLEEELLKVQMQLLEEMQALEALAAAADVEALVEEVLLLVHLPLDTEQMEVSVEREVMEVAAEEVALEVKEVLIAKFHQEQEVQEVLAVLEAEGAEAEIMGLWVVLVLGVVMAQQEVMAEVEGVGVAVIMVPTIMALEALVALD